MGRIRIISDIHQKYIEYLEVLSTCEYSIQLGDFGFDYKVLTDLNIVDWSKHKMFQGNHDNTDIIDTHPGYLGKYGEFELNGIKGFFIGGAFSVDKERRMEYERQTGIKVWWEEEQLSQKELGDAIELYSKIKPDLVISHSCPISVSRKLGSKSVLRHFGFDPDTFTTRTQDALQACLDIHKPQLWHFGHLHLNRDKTWKGTRFICKPELGWIDINDSLEIINES